jgi:cytidyltransferase-like protein
MMKILTFGTFDGVHEGHREMLRHAKTFGDYLLVAVAPDSVVLEMKGAMPQHSSSKRIEMLKSEHLADEVVLADNESSSWKILKKYKPDIIALGYDQLELRASLEEFLEKTYTEVETGEGWQTNPKKPKIVMLSPYKPDKYKSSLMK